MSNEVVEEEEDETSYFRRLVKNRRFDDHTLQILQSLLLFTRSISSVNNKAALIEFLRSESISVMHQMAHHHSHLHLKLSILDFFVRAFALSGDIQSCLAFRYEAFLLRDLNSPTHPSLQVSSSEWMTFAQQSLHNGFPSISVKACQNGLRKDAHACQPIHNNMQAIHKQQLKTLKEIALASAPAASHSVQAQTSEYTRKRTIQNSKDHSPVQTDTPILASNLFRNGIKKQNQRRLHEYQHRLSHSYGQRDAAPF